MKARYKIHKDFPMYRIYNDGRIQNINPIKYSPRHGKYIHNPSYLKFKIPRQHPKWGHLFCSAVRIDGVPNATIHIHKIVAELFIPNPDKKLHVIHLNKNKKNNYYRNLKWVSQADLNYMQYDSGKRDPINEAKNMRRRGGIKDWTKSEVRRLLYLRDRRKLDWKIIKRKMKGRTLGTCQVKYSTLKSAS